MREAFDVAIIGAGAAGLAAAAELGAAGRSIGILEARERVGGRILAVDSLGARPPKQLGAEFIHGESASVFEWLRRTNDVAIDAPQSRWIARRGQLVPADGLFKRMQSSLQRARRPPTDLPFAAFLERNARTIPPSLRTLACTLVEGFDAADATRVSTFDTLKEWSGDSAADAPTFRPARGYGALVQAMARSLDPRVVSFRLATMVREIRWRRGHVVIAATHHGEPLEVEAQRVIVTLPLGVLQLPPAVPGAVRFDPPLTQKERALSRLGFGSVVKAHLNFRRAFWEEIAPEGSRQAPFFIAPQAAFPTFWSMLPWRTTSLVAWSAGRNAERLSGRSIDELVREIIASLRLVFGSRVDYRQLLQHVDVYDWHRDEFSCGGYSYLLAKGRGARRRLAETIEETLYFAGEATDQEEAAAVGGALTSGRRAAREIMNTVA